MLQNLETSPEIKGYFPGLTPSLLYSPAVNFGRDQIILRSNERIQPESGKDKFSPFFAAYLNRRLGQMDACLTQEQIEIFASDPLYESRSYQRTAELTREIAAGLFPSLRQILSEGSAERFFSGIPPDVYINKIALPSAKTFRDWIIGHLPEHYRQPLSLLSDVNSANDLPDLVKLYTGKTVVLASIPDEPAGELFNRQIHHEVSTLLSMMWTLSVIDLSTVLEEEDVLRSFEDQVSSALPDLSVRYLLINLDNEGRCVRINICDNPNEAYTLLHKGKYDLVHPYAVRTLKTKSAQLLARTYSDQFVIFQEREKTEFSTALKAYRNRRLPVTDEMGARFIIGNSEYLEDFIALLKEKLLDWVIEPEGIETRNPDSTITHNVIYFAYRKDKPERRIEVNIEWLREEPGIGSWLQKRFETYQGRNSYAYKMRELLSVLPVFFPAEFYGIDWSLPQVQVELYEHANKQALNQDGTIRCSDIEDPAR